jgi:dipeptidyl aminopeptidase/acylaminoacyl peptidase
MQRLRTMPLPPKLRNVSIAPDGSKVLYEEVQTLPPNGSRQGFWTYFVGRDFDSGDKSVWIVDVRTGKRFALPDVRDDSGAFRIVEYPYASGWSVTLQPRWSPDGKRVAMLQQRADSLVLVIWRTDRAERPTRHPLPRISLDALSSPLITEWQWASEREELFIGLRGTPAPPRFTRDQGDTTRRWWWSASRAMAEKAKQTRPQVMEERLDPQRIVAISLRDGKVREVRPAGSDRVFLANRYSRSGWGFVDRNRIIGRHRNSMVDTIPNNLQMWMVHTDSLGGHAIHDARGSVDLVDARKGALMSLYTGNLGEVTSATLTRGDAQLVMIESTPQLNAYPIHSEWGRIHWVAQKNGAADVVMDTVPLASRLFASDRPDVVYHLDEPRSTLYEVNASTRKRAMISPLGLAVTSLDISEDGRTIAAVLESASRSPQVHVWTTRTRNWQKISDHGPAYPESDLGRFEYHTWRSPDNLFDVDGFVVKPPRFDSTRRYPLLVFLQGGVPTGHMRFENRFDPFLSFAGPLALVFAEAGYISLFVNHRGTYFSDFLGSRSLIGRFGIQLSDVEAAVDNLVKRGWVNEAQLGVLANSHGSDEMMYLLSHSKRYKAAMLNDGTVPFPDLWLLSWAPLEEYFFNSLSDNASRPVMRRLMGFDPVQTVWADPFAMRTPLLIRWSASAYVKAGDRIEGWKASNAGTSFGGTEKLLYAYEANKVPIDVIVDRDNHGIDNMVSLLEWHSRLLQWFDYFLLGNGENPIPAMKSPLDYSNEMK